MTWYDVLMKIIETAIGLIVTVGIPYIFSLLQRNIKSDTQARYLKKVEELVRAAVVQVQQTYVEDMKAAGKFDSELQKVAFQKARDAVLYMLNEETKKIVIDAVGDFDVYIRNKIEEAVSDIK